MMNFNGGVT